MAGIDRLAEVMGVENDFDPVSQSKFLYEVADEIERLRAALEKAKEKLELYRIKNSGKYVGGMEYGALMNLINDLLGKRDECKHDFQVCLLPEGGAMGQCRKCGVIQKTDSSFPILGID